MKHIFTILLFLLPLSGLQAQMFSVGNDESRIIDPNAPLIRVGVEPVQFSYKGDPQAVLPIDRLDVDAAAVYAAFETGGFSLSVTMANSLTGLEDQSFFDLGLTFSNPFVLIRQPNFAFGVPFQLGSKLRSVRSESAADEFSQTDLYAGLGAIASLRFSEKVGILTEFVPGYGFSSSSGGFLGGSVFNMHGKARLNFYGILFNRNVSLGVDYQSSRYDIDGETFDYNFDSLTFSIGVSF